jgi:hypothetical protein
MPPSEQKMSPSGEPVTRRLTTTGLDDPGITTRMPAAVTHGSKMSSPATLTKAPGVELGVHPPVPAHGSRLTDLRTTLPEKSEVVSTQCVGTGRPAALSNCTVAQPRTVHGWLPRFQIPSATTKLPAAAPPSAGESSICNCELAQLGSPTETMTGVGEGVGGANGETSGTVVGCGVGADGDGVTGGDAVASGDCDGGGELLAQAARSVVRTIARIPNPQRTPRSSAVEVVVNRCGIADVITKDRR